MAHDREDDRLAPDAQPSRREMLRRGAAAGTAVAAGWAAPEILTTRAARAASGPSSQCDLTNSMFKICLTFGRVLIEIQNPCTFLLVAKYSRPDLNGVSASLVPTNGGIQAFFFIFPDSVPGDIHAVDIQLLRADAAGQPTGPALLRQTFDTCVTLPP